MEFLFSSEDCQGMGQPLSLSNLTSCQELAFLLLSAIQFWKWSHSRVSQHGGEKWGHNYSDCGMRMGRWAQCRAQCSGAQGDWIYSSTHWLQRCGSQALDCYFKKFGLSHPCDLLNDKTQEVRVWADLGWLPVLVSTKSGRKELQGVGLSILKPRLIVH